MNAVPNIRTKAPRSVAELEAELAHYAALLLQAQRGRNAARVNLPSLLASGDAAGIQAARQEIDKLDAQSENLKKRRDEIEDAIRAAKGRDLAAQAAQDYLVIEQAAAKAKRDVGAIEDAAIAWAKAIGTAITSLESMRTTMLQYGLAPDPVQMSKAHVLNLTEMLLYVVTDGELGKARTLDNIHQLRQSGRASLRRAAGEHYEFTMRRVASALGVQPHSPEAA